jgi:hypothetical protein
MQASPLNLNRKYLKATHSIAFELLPPVKHQQPAGVATNKDACRDVIQA